jgi:3-deoxy-D-arabino-heptulosonate 7-phosphate (DAHP) synthase
MTQTVIRTKPVNLTGLWKFLDELAKETIEVLKKRGISLTVDDFLKERER